MSPETAAAEIERFREIVARRLGLNVDESRLDVLQDVLARRAKEHREPSEHYLDALDGTSRRDELRVLARELTVTETYFFRNPDHFRALAEQVLPERLAARAGKQRLNVLSAGCASGEEPYSLAILLRERGIDPASMSVRAFDVNPRMLAKAERATYSAWALRETPPALERRWFVRQGAEFVLRDAIRTLPDFHECNLTHDDARIWTPATYDVVFCRNVIMYLTPNAAEEAVARISRSLAPGGYLFLGHAETLRGLSQDFQLCHTHGTFYYRQRDAAGAGERPEAPTNGQAPALTPTWADTWVETVQRASTRIELLSRNVLAALPSEAAAVAPSTAAHGSARSASNGADLGLAFELLKQERYEAALGLLGDLHGAAADPEALLLRAVLLTHAGQLAAAASACGELLAIDALNTGAHYVLALCREGEGERQRAVDHDRMAIYLDPSFAMPRLHLGLMARRANDRETARRELSQALMLLQREDTARLLLFGGGFNRDALIALCRAELSAAGGLS